MKRKIPDQHLTPFSLLLIPMAAVIGLAAANYMLFDYHPAPLLCLAGTLSYFCFSLLTPRDPDLNVDYHQSGESSLIFIILLALSLTVSNNGYLLLALSLPPLVLIEMYLHLIAGRSCREQHLIGLTHHILVLMIVLYLWQQDIIKSDQLKPLTAGYGSISSSVYLLIPLGLFATAGLLLAKVLHPEISLFVLGSDYFPLAGLNYRPVRLVLILVRSLYLGLFFSFMGFLGGTAQFFFFLFRKTNPVFKFLSGLFLIMIYSQLLLMLNRFLHYGIILLIAMMISYLSNYYLIRRRNTQDD